VEQSWTVEQVEARVAERAPAFARVRAEVGKVIVGQTALVDRMIVGLLCDGHLLIEGNPGLAKTTAVSTLSRCLGLTAGRVQFTPDLLPADLVGTVIYRPATGDFVTRQGPVFTQVLLADEINRAPPKVQSALLEAMQERQVTVGDRTTPLPRPFLVLATQNPIEQEGTYPLPEAQLDRFLLKVRVGYPTAEDELQIVTRSAASKPDLVAVLGAAEIADTVALVRQIRITDALLRYIVAVVRATRDPGAATKELSRAVAVGASPRASIALAAAARAAAFLDGRGYALPEDVKAMAPDVLRHRVLPSVEAEADGIDADRIVSRLLDAVDMP
jgi:MoxR-like ATPase